MIIIILLQVFLMITVIGISLPEILNYLWYRRNFVKPYKNYKKKLKITKSKERPVYNFSYAMPVNTSIYLDYYSHFDTGSLFNLKFEIEKKERISNANTQYINFLISAAAIISLILAAISNIKDSYPNIINQGYILIGVTFIAGVSLCIVSIDSMAKLKVYNKLAEQKRYIERCIQDKKEFKTNDHDTNQYKKTQKNKGKRNSNLHIANKK